MSRRISAIWQYFQEVKEDKKSNWVCVICKTVGSCKNTSNQWKHLEFHHKEVWEEIKGKKQPAKRRRRENDESHRLLDNDEGMGEDNDAVPSDNAGPSGATSAAAANNAGPSSAAAANNAGPSSAAAANNAGPSGATSAATANNAGPSNASSAANATESGRSSSQSSFNSTYSEPGSVPYPINGAHMQAIVRALALFIVRGMQPLSLIEDEHFREFIKAIDPRITLPCRSTLTKTILPEIYAEAKSKMLAELSQAKHVALTTDCWTSSTMASYLTVTAHYINDDKVKLIARVLATTIVEVSHTSENLAEIIKGICATFMIPMSKIVAVVTDNAANMVKTVKDILKLKHVPCFAHTLSLAVKAAIHSDNEFSAILEKCRNIVTYFHSSSHATAKLNMCCYGKAKKKLVQECPTRWNSTFSMIKSLLDLKTEVEEALTLCHKTDSLLDPWEWECLSGALQLLQPCQFLTADLSSTSYPSVSKVLPSSKILRDKIDALTITNHHDALILMSSNLRQNINDRLAEYRMNTIHLVSTYLDPRYKTEYLIKDTPQVGARFAEDNIIYHVVRQFANDSFLPTSVNAYSTPEDDISTAHNSFIDQINASRQGQGSSSSANALIVLADYKKRPLQHWNEDPLKFWSLKKKEGVLLPLFPVAMKYLCVPATSVPSEELFSCAGDLIREARSRLSPDNVDMLLFLYKNA